MLIIGIGGLSRSGKSALAKQLQAYYIDLGKTVCLIHQDEFVRHVNTIPKINHRTDWEHPDSMDFEQQYKTVIENKNRFDIILLEGILVFYNEDLNSLFDCRILCEIDKANFIRRKRKDTRWGIEPDWYIEHIWESYFTYGRSILENTNPSILDSIIIIQNHAFENKIGELVALIENQ